MRIGYPCLNLTIGCKGDHTFRLKSYSEERLVATVESNLACLLDMLEFNVEHDILFFRITSDLVPFASHPICTFDWLGHFRDRFEVMGEYIRRHNIRISMHPDQFTLINSPDQRVFDNSVRELLYHANVLDAMGLNGAAKIQIHVGGVYGDRMAAMARFAHRFETLPEPVRRRLVIENDDRLYGLSDCMKLHSETSVPVLFDALHHRVYNAGETVAGAFEMFHRTWKPEDGLPMVDYSLQQKGARSGRHVETIDEEAFTAFLAETWPYDFDIMLEIKDKETSALKAVELARSDPRFRGGLG
jgi:UV DNA damage endonuclease